MSNYSSDELIKALIFSKLIVPIDGGRFLVSTTLGKHLKANNKSSRCVNFPEEWEGLSDAVIYKKVMDLCEIDLKRKSTSGDYYFLRTTTKESVSVLKHIFKSSDIDFNRFISSVRDAYEQNIKLPGFANFLVNGLWREMYDNGSEDTSYRKRDRKGII